MRKIIRSLFLTCFVLVCAILFAFLGTNKSANALLTEDFIRKPTFSVYFDNKIFFVDDYDNYLKVFDLSTKKITYEEENLIGETVVGANFDDGKLYVLTISADEKLNDIYVFDLSNGTKKIYDISEFELGQLYNQIFVQNTIVDGNPYQIISISATGQYPVILKINDADEITKTQLNYSAQNHILFSSMAYHIENSNINIISVLFANNKLLVTNGVITFDKLNGGQIETFLPSEFSLSDAEKLSFEGQISPLNSTLTHFNESLNLVITYNEIILEQVNYGTRLFKCEIGDSSDTTLTFKDNISNSNKYLIANENHICFPNQQDNSISLITYDEDYSSTINKNCAVNPQIELTYLGSKDAIFYQTKQSTGQIEFYNDPWQSKSNFSLELTQKTDLLQIATAKIVYNQIQNDVDDYVYCIYTAESNNYRGFVKKELLEAKELTDVEVFEYKAKLKMKEGAKLYSYPTKILEEFNSETSSNIVCSIDENSLVDLILDENKVASFVSNGTKWLKVKVNGNEIGYIDCNYIVSTNNTINYIVPNATILNNDTQVFISNSKQSIVTYTLKAGKRVKVIGARDPKTGLTKISFNNEFGDEFNGFIVSEHLKTDNWSTLQIIGCILIAINTGLLILILLFKKRHIKVKDELYTIKDGN